MDAGASAPVFVAVHDISRNAQEIAIAFQGVCDRYGVILVAPHFSAERHPNYQRLGPSRESGVLGTFANAALDSILEEVASLSGSSTQRFHLFGFGAGGRFAMRYALAHPTRVAGAVLAAAATYTFPNPERRFPRGIDAGPGRPDLQFDPRQFLAVPMTLLEARPNGVAVTQRPLERVGRSEKSGGGRNGRNWVAAMSAAAVRSGLEPLLVRHEVEVETASFKGFLEQAALPDRVFEALFGLAPGQDALVFSGEPDELAADETSLSEDAEEETPWRRLRRMVLPAVVSAGVCALLAPLVLWAHFRLDNVVSQDAVVRGHIAEVGVRVDGVVESILVDVGDHVEAGQVIARLQDRQFKAKVRQASSHLEKSTRELEVELLAIENEELRLEGALREVAARLSAAEADVRVSESREEEALRRLEIQQSLSSQGLVAQEIVNTAETELRTAGALVEASRADRTAAVASQELVEVESKGLAVRRKRVAVLESGIEAYRAELAVAEANLDGAVLRAPDDGAVVQRIVEPGGVAVVGQPILSLWLGGDTWVEAWVDERELGDLEVGSSATITFNSYPGREFTGKVETISVSTDFELPDSAVPQPRGNRMRDEPMIAVRIQLEDSDAVLFPGLSASVGIRKKGH